MVAADFKYRADLIHNQRFLLLRYAGINRLHQQNEFHLAFLTDDYDAAHEKHKQMGCICFENPEMGK